MIGHGSPSPSRCGRWTQWSQRAWAGVTIGILFIALAPHSSGAEQRTLRIRAAWGGGEARQWHGSVEVTHGAISELVPLGVEADEPGSMWIDRGKIILHGPSSRTYDGFDCTIDAPADAKLLVHLSSKPTAPHEPPYEIPLSALINESSNTDLNDGANRLLVRRSPGDQLQVKLDRDALVFNPGETLTMKLRPSLWGLAPSARVKIRSDLRGGDGRSWWTNEVEQTADAEGNLTADLPLEIPVPNLEGVYHLEFVANLRRLGALNLKSNLADRRVQFVVVDGNAPASAAKANEAAWTKVVEINPASSTWWERMAKLPLLPGLRKGPLGTSEAHPWQHPLGQLIQLGPGGNEPRISWQAYPLPIEKVGAPHIVEIEYPSDVPQVMGLSIIEPNAAGDVMPIGLDSGLYVPGESATETPRLLTHRLTIWPKTKTPMLLITNRRDGSQAVYGKIRVLAGPERLPSAALEGQLGERLYAAYYDRPLFPENFGAAESLDAGSGRSLDDWMTFYQGGTRLVEYLEHAGYNGAIVSVLADGSTLYPCAGIEPTPRYDTGVFFGNGQDPSRKDVLELLLRLFDRKQMALIPALDFSAPLPELEAICRSGPAAATGIELIGREGRPWRVRRQPMHGLAPHYNLLDARVQQALFQRVRELSLRYGAHAAFAGLSLQLSGEGYAQLPGLDWGYDDRTIAQFCQETGITLNATGPQRFAARATLLMGTHRAAWQNWRTERISQFYARLAAEVQRANPRAKLYLAAANALENLEFQHELQPTLPARGSVEDALRSAGIDPDLGQRSPNIVLLRPQRLSPPTSLAARAVDLGLNDNPDLDRHIAASPVPATLCYHEPQKARVASFDRQSPYRQTYTWLVSEMSPADERNRRRFARSLATLDAQAIFDGGWLLPLGQEAALADLVAIYRRLPAVKFDTFAGTTQPITIRTAVHDGAYSTYLVNDSPWPVEVDTEWQLPDGCQREGLSPTRELEPLVRKGSGASWRVALRPYEVVGARFDSPSAKLTSARVTLPGNVASDLEMRIRDLQALALALRNQAPLETLANANFEQPGKGPGIPGWVVTEQAGVTAELGGTSGATGQSMRFTSLGPVGSVASLPITPPDTGRLEIVVRLRVDDPARQPPLRIAIDGRQNGEEYYRHAAVGKATERAQIGKEWTQFVFQVDDLPLKGLSQLRVRFDLMGAGNVWIDDVQLHPLRFFDNENIELLLIITSAQVKLQEGQYSDCLRLVESYWAQFLAQHVPLTQQPLVARPAESAPSEPAATDTPAAARPPQKTTRFQKWIPEKLRPF